MNDWAIVHEAPNTTPRHHVRFFNKIKIKKTLPIWGKRGQRGGQRGLSITTLRPKCCCSHG